LPRGLGFGCRARTVAANHCTSLLGRQFDKSGKGILGAAMAMVVVMMVAVASSGELSDLPGKG